MSDWVDAESCIERALQLSDSQQWEGALEHLDAALAINPHEASWHAQRGQVLDQLERYQEATQAYRSAVELEPDQPELSTLLGIDLIRTEKYSEALEVYERHRRARAGI